MSFKIGRYVTQTDQVIGREGPPEAKAWHEWSSCLKSHLKIMWNMRSLLYSFSNE